MPLLALALLGIMAAAGFHALRSGSAAPGSGATTNVTLSPGIMGPYTIGRGAALQLVLASGGAVTDVSSPCAPSCATALSKNAQGALVQARATGSDTISVAWTDGAGNPNVARVLVTVA